MADDPDLRRGQDAVGVPARPTVAFFGHDCTEMTVIKRARTFARCGLEVTGFTFRRRKFNRDYKPEWDDISLGMTVDRHYGARLLRLVRALPILVRERRRLARADFIYARNIDMCALALFARAVARSRAPVAYEVLDVQRVFVGRGLVSALFRWAERNILRRCELLVVSSPAFVSAYFAPVQGYAGPWYLLENKIFAQSDALRGARPSPQEPGGPPLPPAGPWVIAWLGNLRCPQSPQLLTRLARALGPRVRIHIHGYPTETGLERFLELISGHDNIVYFGEYRPQDLAKIYGQAHFAWAFDYLDVGTNSDWLLPNRLYEGCYFGVPALCAKGTETGRRVEEQGSGWALGEPVADEAARLLEGLDHEAYLARRRALLALPGSVFVDEGDTAALAQRLLAAAARAGSVPAARSLAST